ncbi:hypothetical protein [Gallaecimonas mangrovi]|uniref:hypothetical protein n=1 Tax=Gallaecimonas mangrovi TaxID=2291597 RepID=UPI00299F5873|nr:hypothetical protein [Gallaecimonas mangrovi]
MTEQVTQALNWLTALLARQQLPYQIVGGLAAHLYGGSRPVADIDLYIPAAKA